MPKNENHIIKKLSFLILIGKKLSTFILIGKKLSVFILIGKKHEMKKNRKTENSP
jgi:hypothetical protein